MAHKESLPISLTRRDAAGLSGDPRFTVVWLAGEHDASTNIALAAVLDRASELDNADVVVDLSAVTFLDASVIGTLIAARNRLATRSLSLQLRAPSIVAARLLARCGLTDGAQRQASALGTWVEVPPQSVSARAEVDSRKPAFVEAQRGVS